jgi:hypothetical protein
LPFASARATAAESSDDSSPANSLNDFSPAGGAAGASLAGDGFGSSGLRKGRKSIGGGVGFIGLTGVALRCEPMRMRFFSAESSGDGALGSVFITSASSGERSRWQTAR